MSFDVVIHASCPLFMPFALDAVIDLAEARGGIGRDP